MVILAVIVVVSLIVVSLLINSTSGAEGISSGTSKVAGWTNTISVTESAISPDGNYLVRLANNTGEPLTIKTVSVGEEDVSFSEDLFQGSQQGFKVSSEVVCEIGQTITADLVVTYVSQNGLDHTETFPADIAFVCDDYVVSLLADQCEVCEGADPVELHSGQTTVYDADGDDATHDGTAKSYTDNGDGTVTDNHTGLMWAKDHSPETGGNCNQMPNWGAAIDYCEASTTGGYSDWRVPSIVELITFADYNCVGVAGMGCTNDAFTANGWGSTCYGYWSSTATIEEGQNRRYTLYYSNSSIVSSGWYDFWFGVRCVRFEN